MEEEITFSEVAMFLVSVGRDDLVLEIAPEFRQLGLGPELDQRQSIDDKFMKAHGSKISDALLDQADSLAERDGDEALNFMIASMHLLSKMSNTANKNSLGRAGNYVLKSVSKWKKVADKIKTKVGANGYTIGANLGLSLGIYVEFHF